MYGTNELPIFFEDLNYGKQMDILRFYGVTSAEQLGWGIGGNPIITLVPEPGETTVINETIYIDD